MAKRIDTLQEEPEIGGIYAVPCFVVYIDKRFEEMWNDDRYLNNYRDQVFVIPVYNHPHSDRENGQPHAHYHVDTRFAVPKHVKNIKLGTDYVNRRIFSREQLYNEFCRYYHLDAKPYITCNFKIKYFDLALQKENEGAITPLGLISKSKFKHKCIHKGKCPHRGYDLSATPAIKGVITCPLHNLKFDAQTKKMLVDHDFPNSPR